MRPSDRDREQRDEIPVFDPWFETARAGEESSAPSQHTQEVRLRRASSFGATQSSFRAASAALEDALNRLQHIRNTLQDLEANGSIVRRTITSSTQRPPVGDAENDFGPSHTAIILSDDDDLSALDPDALRNRLDELGATLPQYIRSAASIIRNITNRTASELQAARANSQVSTLRQAIEEVAASIQGSTTFSRGPTALPTYVSRSLTPPHTQTSNAASGRFIRPRRNSNPFSEGVTVYRRQEANRDDDPASTTLGRRVVSRAAAAASGSSTAVTLADQRLRAPARPALSDHLYPPRTVSGSTSTSRIPTSRPRLALVPAQRVQRLDRDVHDRMFDDSEGSETEVDVSMDRMSAHNHLGASRGVARGQRRLWNDGLPLPPLRSITSFGPSEVGGVTSLPGAVSSPRRETDERQAITSLRMREMRERLDRISNALSNTSRDRRLAAAFADRELEGDPFTYLSFNPDEVAAGENGYRDIIEGDEGRTYRTRRRVNADGDEQVHRIHTDEWWTHDDDFADSIFVPASSRITGGGLSVADRLQESNALVQHPHLQNETTNHSSSGTEFGRLQRRANRAHTRPDRLPDLPPLNAGETPAAVTRRRRGWARLNADGDEIPTDEEEENDRVLTEQRVRNSQAMFNNAFSSASRSRPEYLTPTTRNVFPYGMEESGEGDIANVRLNLPTGQAHRRVQQFGQNVLITEAHTERESFGTLEPYYICPLPIPLERMALSAGLPKHLQAKQSTFTCDSEMAAR